MVEIPGGKFPMGSPFEEGQSNERPLHVVSLSAFAIDRYEVTAEQYAACVASGSCTQAGSGTFQTMGVAGAETHPINFVTWADAGAYCAWVGKVLPTEAQWERAANGPGGTDGLTWRRYPWSTPCTVTGPPASWPPCAPESTCPAEFNSPAMLDACEGEPWTAATARANCDEVDCHDGYPATAPVGSFPGGASVEGVHDLSGNVFEWVRDAHQSDFYATAGAVEPDPVKTAGEKHSQRGGGCDNFGYNVRVANRYGAAPSVSNFYLGFRCALGASLGAD